MYQSHRQVEIEMLELMVQETKEKSELMDSDFKRKFMEKEILDLQQYILKDYAKKGINKTEDEVQYSCHNWCVLRFFVKISKKIRLKTILKPEILPNWYVFLYQQSLINQLGQKLDGRQNFLGDGRPDFWSVLI